MEGRNVRNVKIVIFTKFITLLVANFTHLVGASKNSLHIRSDKTLKLKFSCTLSPCQVYNICESSQLVQANHPVRLDLLECLWARWVYQGGSHLHFLAQHQTLSIYSTLEEIQEGKFTFVGDSDLTFRHLMHFCPWKTQRRSWAWHFLRVGGLTYSQWSSFNFISRITNFSA